MGAGRPREQSGADGAGTNEEAGADSPPDGEGNGAPGGEAPDGTAADGGIDWNELIATGAGERVVALRAVRHEGGSPTASRPQRYVCDDGALYSVKFAENEHGDGRGTFAEQVVSLGGRLIGAPVAQVALAHVTADLIAQLSLPFQPTEGPHHASRWADGYSERQHIQYVDENREGFGALHVLYTWMLCNGDHQFIYRNAPPHDVLSVDHSAFFPGGPTWTEASVTGAPAVVEDPILAPLGLAPEHRADALAKLAGVSPTDIARIVSAPPDQWGVPLQERVAVARYLYSRQNETRALFAP